MAAGETIEVLNAVGAECGCCEHHRCCRPLVVCRSLPQRVTLIGYQPPADSNSTGSDEDPEHPLRFGKIDFDFTFTLPADVVSTYPGGVGTYTSEAYSGSVSKTRTLEHGVSFEADYGDGGCPASPRDEISDTCAGGGTWTRQNYTAYFSGGAWHNFLRSEAVHTITDISGTETPEHIAWDSTSSDEEPGEFYPECTFKEVITTTVHPHPLDPDDVWTVPETTHIPAPSIPVSPTSETYGTPIPWAGGIAAAEEWLDANVPFDHTDVSDVSDSNYCTAGTSCIAQMAIDADGFTRTIVQYQLRLNKCCPWIEIRSEWFEVFFSEEYLEWLEEIAALGSSDEAPPAPEGGIVPTPKVWEWTGTPPRCEDSTSDSSADPVDPFDDPTMWSPWSLPMKLTAEQAGGIMVLKRYRQQCYENVPDEMPEVFGDFNLSDSIVDVP